MTTKLHDVIAIEPSGIVLVCAWCVDRARRLELRQRGLPVSDGICPTCRQKLEATS